MHRITRRRAATGAFLLAALAFSQLEPLPEARAANPDCASLPSPIYGAGGSSQVPLVKQIATQLSKLSTPVTVVYQSAGGACVGYEALVTPTAITGTANYWDATGTQQTCNLDIAGNAVTIAVMGNSATLCPGVTQLAAGFGDFEGPAQSYDFIVPVASSQQSISAEAAYFVYGFGASDPAHTVSPWSQLAEIIRRDQNSGATIAVSQAIGVPPAKFLGTDGKTNTGVLTDVANAATPENAIGYVSGEVADGNRATVRALAYQHTGQTCGYWPDSTKDAFDKTNVRDGQYWIWSPVHLFAAVDGSGKITDAPTASLIGYLTGSVTPPAGIDPFKAAVAASTVPKCAMHAWRTGDLSSAPYSYADLSPCGCKFDALATGKTTCATCNVDTDCGSSSPHCRYGYCEVN
jgi:hypothetical protein